MRLLGFVLFVLGLVLLGLDWWASADPQNVELRLIGDLWATYHRESLLVAQPAVERYAAPWLWNPIIQSILLAPAAVFFGGLGLALLLVSRFRARRRGA
ncbi:MAG: hypothetical protein AAGC92_09685 [Pseudomonadota bacterium]